MQEKVSAQYVNEIQMAKAQRDYELKKATYDYEVNTKKAESEMAYQLQVPSPLTLLPAPGTQPSLTLCWHEGSRPCWGLFQKASLPNKLASCQ